MRNSNLCGSVKDSFYVRSGDTVKLNLSNKNSLTLTNYRSLKINKLTSAQKIQKTTSAYNDESEVVISGTKSNNYICNEGDSVTIDAGAGHDYILNVSTNDVSVAGGAGNDLLWGSYNADMLQITGKFTATYDSSKDEVYFKVGSTKKAITLKEFSATSFNVNGTSYQISGSKLK